jgi:hypothetical protein
MGVSDDGRTIVGNGINPAGLSEPWLAHIPEPATFAIAAMSGLAFLHRRRGRVWEHATKMRPSSN